MLEILNAISIAIAAFALGVGYSRDVGLAKTARYPALGFLLFNFAQVVMRVNDGTSDSTADSIGFAIMLFGILFTALPGWQMVSAKFRNSEKA